MNRTPLPRRLAENGARRKRGAGRVSAVLGDFAAATIASEPLMGFVQREAERALRLLRTRSTFVYADAIAGETPDPAKVRQAVRALLRG